LSGRVKKKRVYLGKTDSPTRLELRSRETSRRRIQKESARAKKVKISIGFRGGEKKTVKRYEEKDDLTGAGEQRRRSRRNNQGFLKG